MTGHKALQEPASAGQEPAPRLFNRGFVLISLAFFLIFCNMAIFFEFYEYLEGLKIPKASLGLIMGLFSLTALLLRPFISLVINPFNAKRWFIMGALGTVAALMLYSFATSAVSLILVRVMHGGFYVLMAAASVAALVGFIDMKHSGQAFGLLAVITIVPYAVVPPLTEILHKVIPSYTQILAFTGLAILLVIPLVLLVPSPKAAMQQAAAKVGWNEAKQCLMDRRLIFVLLSALLMYVPFTAVFYFLNSYASSLKIVDAGLFFTVATGTEIGIRILFGRYFDLLPKSRLLAGALILLAAAYYVLTLVSALTWLLVLAVAFGFGWGLAMPMVNALIFDLSKPEMRSFATNLGYEVFQGGFFLGPLAGAWMVQTFGYGGLFIACAGACLAGAAFMLFFEREDAAKRREAAQL